MVKYYLNEEPILNNAPTYLPFYEEDRKYVLENLKTLVIKDVAEELSMSQQSIIKIMNVIEKTITLACKLDKGEEYVETWRNE